MAKGGGQKVNRTQLAAVFGCAMPTVDAWLRAGCPYDVKGSGKGKPWVFDTADVARWRELRAADEAGGGTMADENQLKRRRLQAGTVLEELELAKAQGLVAPVDQMERRLSRVFIEIRTNLRNIPGRVVAQLLGEHDERKFKAALLAEIDGALNALADLDLTATEDDDEDDDAE